MWPLFSIWPQYGQQSRTTLRRHTTTIYSSVVLGVYHRVNIILLKKLRQFPYCPHNSPQINFVFYNLFLHPTHLYGIVFPTCAALPLASMHTLSSNSSSMSSCLYTSLVDSVLKTSPSAGVLLLRLDDLPPTLLRRSLLFPRWCKPSSLGSPTSTTQVLVLRQPLKA